MAIFIRSAHNYDMREAGKASALVSDEESLTKQEFKDECDINTILRRFNVTGQLPVGVRMPTYGDFSEVTDFHDAVNAIALAREAFSQMSAEVRRRFNNDPGEFVDFTSDPANLPEARKLGLVPVDDPPPAPVPGGAGPATPAPQSALPPEGGPAVPPA